ncbi:MULTISPECIES: hypothetical protein [unclassified Vibrio]|uniref:hypothetical protein n=1 Tax=unclassified Vibrio TaxID=2614977 RepID=UPI00354F9F0A
MIKKSILVCGCVLFVFAIMVSQRNLSPELIFPKCEINKSVQSKITFYIDESVVYKSEIVGKLHEAVAMSHRQNLKH